MGDAPLPFLAELLASFGSVRLHPGVGERCKSGGNVLADIGLSLGSPDDDRIHNLLIGFRVLPKPQLVALHFGEVSLCKSMEQLLSHDDHSPGSRPVVSRRCLAPVDEELGHGSLYALGKCSASLVEVLLVGLAPATECSGRPAPLVLGAEALDGLQVHLQQFPLGGRLRPHISAAGDLLIVLELDAEHFKPLHRFPLGREVVDVPCFVDGLVLFLFLDPPTILSAHWPLRVP